MRTLAAQLWNQQDGAIITMELLFIATLLIIGSIAGLSSLRDSIVTEFADLAQAFANFNQSYSFSGVAGHHAFTAGSSFFDLVDFCDTADPDAPGQQSKCVVICSVAAMGEGRGHHHHGGKGW